MITEDYVSFEVAKLLKEKGFNANITTYRDDFIQHGNIVISLQECLSKDKVKTPTLQMAMKWLREVHNIHISFRPIFTEDAPYWYNTSVYQVETHRFRDKHFFEHFETYEGAAEAAIKYCLENLI